MVQAVFCEESRTKGSKLQIWNRLMWCRNTAGRWNNDDASRIL